MAGLPGEESHGLDRVEQGQEYRVVGEQFLSWGRHGQPDMMGEARREASRD